MARQSCVAFVLGRRNGLDLMVGTVSGHLIHLDVNNPNSLPTLELGAHSRPVRSICPTGDDAPYLIASCADDRRTVVASVDPAHHNIMYVIHSAKRRLVIVIKVFIIFFYLFRYSNEERHKDIVRGLAWNDGRLFSCGWDQQIVLHDISSSATSFWYWTFLLKFLHLPPSISQCRDESMSVIYAYIFMYS